MHTLNGGVRLLKEVGWRCLAASRRLLGARSRFGIMAGYQHRQEVVAFDDTGMTDEWQREVYMLAADLVRDRRNATVYDVGCGSGYKLLKYLGEFRTVGFDRPETVCVLRERYPGRDWRAEKLDARGMLKADLVICADVIEHVSDPDQLLDFIDALAGCWIVLSTPVRELLYPPHNPRRYGPPQNPCHLREWSFEEFGRYIAGRFDVVKHVVTNPAQATQMIVARRCATTTDTPAHA
jgi:SAM-dependent methyltransferase